MHVHFFTAPSISVNDGEKSFKIETYILVSASPLASIVHACAKHQDVWLAPPPSCPLPVWPLATPPHSRAPSNHEERCHQTAGSDPELQSTRFQFTIRTTDTKALTAECHLSNSL